VPALAEISEISKGYVGNSRMVKSPILDCVADSNCHRPRYTPAELLGPTAIRRKKASTIRLDVPLPSRVLNERKRRGEPSEKTSSAPSRNSKLACEDWRSYEATNGDQRR